MDILCVCVCVCLEKGCLWRIRRYVELGGLIAKRGKLAMLLSAEGTIKGATDG